MHTCIPSHGLKGSRHSCSRRANAGNKNTASMHQPRRQNVTKSMVGLKMVTHAEIAPKMVNPRDIAGNAEEEEEEEEEDEEEEEEITERLCSRPSCSGCLPFDACKQHSGFLRLRQASLHVSN